MFTKSAAITVILQTVALASQLTEQRTPLKMPDQRTNRLPSPRKSVDPRSYQDEDQQLEQAMMYGLTMGAVEALDKMTRNPQKYLPEDILSEVPGTEDAQNEMLER